MVDLIFFHRRPKCGGGGNRTRVPRHLHADFYVRSRMIYALVTKTPNRRGEAATSRQRFLIPGVANSDPGRSGIVAGSRTSPAKVLSRGNLSLGGHCEIRPRQLSFLVGFLRGLLTNHGAPSALQLPGRIQFAPGEMHSSPSLLYLIGMICGRRESIGIKGLHRIAREIG